MTPTATATAPTASEEVRPATAHQAPAHPSEALIVACLLAELSGPTGNISLMSADRLRVVVANELRQTTHARILQWTQHADPAEHRVRWNSARQAVSRVYPELPGATSLPEFGEAFSGSG